MPDYVGQSVRRSGVEDRVTGRLTYAADLKLPGMLHARLVTIECAHGRILRIDDAAARRLPGVRAVISAADLPRPMPRYGPVEEDRPVLAVDETRYYGEPVAIVAAESEDAARRAAELVRVDYEEIPGVFTLEEALRKDAPLVQPPALRPQSPFRGTNIYNEWHYAWGDVPEAVPAALVVENTYRFPMQTHFAIEPHVFMAAPAHPDGVTVWSTVQHPFPLQRAVAGVLGLPVAKVRVVATEMGGAFGGKGYPKFEPLMAFLALHVRRPVRLVFSLAESFLAGRRASAVVSMRTGFDADGRLVSHRARSDYLVGAYADITARIVGKAGYVGGGPYGLPNLDVTARAVFSHTPPATAYRGFGAPQYLWALESQIEEAARRLAIDRLEIRLRNLPPKGSALVPGDTPVDGEWGAGLRRAADAIGWSEPPAPRRGRGLAIGIKTPRAGATSQAIVRLHHDGSASVLVGTTEMGQGSKTVLAQIAAQVLGIALGNVRVVSGDTDTAPFDAITAASRSTVCMGNAVIAACEEVKRKLATLATERTDAVPDSAEVGAGHVRVGGEERTYADVITTAYGAGEGQVVGFGEFRQPRDPAHPMGGQALFWEIIFVAAEVEVDEETGRYRVTRLATAADIGKAINPAHVEGQDEGGAMMGLGQAMMEQLVLDERGIPRNLGAMDYRVPTAMDVPEVVRSLLLENADGPGPFGAKGVGESGAIAVAPAIGFAVSAATGVAFTELPITAERVWEALNAAR